MEQEQEDGNCFPTVGDTMEIPRDFMRQIAGPDDQQSGECQVCPKHGKSQQQISEMMENLRTGDLGQGPAVALHRQ